MSSDVHDTLWSTEEQHRAWLDNQWEDEVVARLPADLEVQAAKHKAWRRKRAIKSAADLLRALLAYVLCAPSFRRLGAWAVLIGLANICEKAWRKHLRQANVWLLWLCGELIASPVASHWLRERQTGRVLIVDATCIRQVGGSGDDWRLHTAYDLCAGRLCQVSITDRHGGEGFSYYGLQAGDIVVADRGYGFRCSVAYAAGRGAYVVLRFVLKNFPVEDEQGEAIDLLAWAEQSSEPVCSRCCYSRWEGQRAPVRVIIRRLSEEEASKAREQLLKKAKKNGRTVSEQAWKAAGWLWLVTTLPAEDWSEQDVLRFYRGRWHTELVYKRMKQLLALGQVRSKQREMVEATIRLRLIAWALQEQEASQIRAQLAQAVAEEPAGPAEAGTAEAEVSEVGPQSEIVASASYAGPISGWLVTSLCLDLLAQQVRSYWSAARLHACLPLLRRFCGSSPRRRVHQETMLRAWLAPPRSQACLQVKCLA